jgi:hypothetical protein
MLRMLAHVPSMLRGRLLSNAVVAAATSVNVLHHTSNACQTRTQRFSTAAPPTFNVLHYSYVADILERRGPFRDAHLAAAAAAAERGDLLLGGALSDAVSEGGAASGAMFVFRADEAVARAFAAAGRLASCCSLLSVYFSHHVALTSNDETPLHSY